MDMSTMKALAKSNFNLALNQNPYPGRGIIVGLDETSQNLVQVYWIMGRSTNSRNRVFRTDNTGRLYTEPADPSKVTDASLIIYNAMREAPSIYVVSNGDQTDTVVEGLSLPFSLELGLKERQYEPDAPNFTQRITAVSMIGKEGRGHYIGMSILRKSRFSERCEKSTYELDPPAGYGYCVTTYAGDGDPLPPFRGDPLFMPLQGNSERIAETYWDALDGNNRVALAVKWIDVSTGRSETHIMNKY